MMLQDIIYISVICFFCYFPAAVVGCPTTIQGWTYELHAGEYLSIPDIGSVSLCESECLASSFCQAFTYEENQPVNYCYLFVKLSPLLIGCHDCTTSTITKIRSGVSCQNEEDDEIDALMTESVDQCVSACQSNDLCTYFLWFDAQAAIPHHCFLFSSVCEAFTDCYNCKSGSLHCLTQPATTFSTSFATTTLQPTTETTTATTQNPASTTRTVACLNTTYPYDFERTVPSPTSLKGRVPIECEEYQLLDDYTRNSRCGVHSRPYVDNDNGGYYIPSPDWKGGNQWYRFVPPAGLVIPESSLLGQHCGTEHSGWLNDSHPQQAGESKEAQVCFSVAVGDYPDFYHCEYSIQINITHCSNFYVYWLQEVSYHNHGRYCGTDYN